MPTSTSQPEPSVCDATPVRYFTVIGRFDVLVSSLGSPVQVPRQVFDPDDDLEMPGALVSEIGSSERYFRTRSRRDPEATGKWGRFMALRHRNDIEILDLTDGEDEAYTELRSAAFTRVHRLAAPLGAGEAAVIAIAENRGLRVIMDDGPARRVLGERSPGHQVLTTRDLLRAAASDGVISREVAQLLYQDMLAEGYRGPAELG